MRARGCWPIPNRKHVEHLCGESTGDARQDLWGVKRQLWGTPFLHKYPVSKLCRGLNLKPSDTYKEFPYARFFTPQPLKNRLEKVPKVDFQQPFTQPPSSIPAPVPRLILSLLSRRRQLKLRRARTGASSRGRSTRTRRGWLHPLSTVRGPLGRRSCRHRQGVDILDQLFLQCGVHQAMPRQQWLACTNGIIRRGVTERDVYFSQKWTGLLERSAMTRGGLGDRRLVCVVFLFCVNGKRGVPGILHHTSLNSVIHCRFRKFGPNQGRYVCRQQGR